jgi:hypothetical protein
MSNVPTSTGIGAPGTGAAPASLARSPMSSTPQAAAATAVPFVRGSSLATMQDSSGTWLAGSTGSTNQVQLQTNAFLAYLVLEIVLTTASNAATVAFAADGPWNVISQITLNDPANQAIIAPISGYGAYLMSKYLSDTGCFYDPKQDPFYVATTGGGGTGGSFSFRLVIPVEHRARDALGAVNNSAANQRYLLGVNIVAPSTSNVYSTAPTTAAANVSYAITQLYWTSPPAAITTSGGSTAVQQTPTGLGTVGFIRYETHSEVLGGGTPQIQLNNVGDYLSDIIYVLRDTSSTGPRDINATTQSSTQGNWPNPFTWWVNDFQVHSVPLTYYVNRMARFYRYNATVETAGGLDNGVFPLLWLKVLLDRMENFMPASQYLPTDATTKLQIRGATFGSGAAVLQVFTRAIRPVSGAALFA